MEALGQGLTHILWAPSALINGRVESIVPPLGALVSTPCTDLGGDSRPFQPAVLDRVAESLVFGFGPSSLVDGCGDLVIIAFSTIFVGPAWHVGRDGVPLQGLRITAGFL